MLFEPFILNLVYYTTDRHNQYNQYAVVDVHSLA